MSRAGTLRDLKKKLKRKEIALKKEEDKLIDSNGRVDMEVFEIVEFKRTEIYIIKRKISFLKQGKSPLGKDIKGFEY